MSIIFNENTYFTKNTYINNITLNDSSILNINNMSVTGDISINNITNTNISLSSLNSSSNLINISSALLPNNLYSTINSTNYINYTQKYSIPTITSITTSTTTPYATTNITLPNGIYIFSYIYVIVNVTSTGGFVINNLEEYIYNTISGTSTIIVKNSHYCKLDYGGGWGYAANNNAWCVLTSTVNTISLNFKLVHVSGGTPTINIDAITFVVTRIA